MEKRLVPNWEGNLSPCLLNFYADYLMKNAGLDEAQSRINLLRNINNLRYVDDTILMAGNEELKSFLMKVKEESEKAGLNSILKKL